MNELTPELQAIAIKELNEVPARVPQYLLSLREWLDQQPHLKARTDDKFLLHFLRGSKYSLEKAKERLDLYYTLKTKYPEMFQVTDILSPVEEKTLNWGFFSLLPKPLDDCGPRIAVYRCNYSASDHNINEKLRCAAAILDWTFYTDPYASIYGMIYIFDMSLYTRKHMRISPGMLKKFFAYFTKTLPQRIKGIFFLNTSAVALQLYRLLMTFAPEKIKQRICICGKDMKELLAMVPLEYLPQDYGGSNGWLDEVGKDWKTTLQDNASFFKENSDYGVDESRRPGKPIDFNGIYGMEGSFQKLELD